MTNNSIYSGASPEQVAADLAPLVDFQDEGLSLASLEEMISTHLLPHLMRYDLPQFQSMFNAFPSAQAKLGAEIALKYNQGVTNWQVSPGGAMLEELCGQALCRLFGLGTRCRCHIHVLRHLRQPASALYGSCTAMLNVRALIWPKKASPVLPRRNAWQFSLRKAPIFR